MKRKALLHKYTELLAYIFWGAATTVVNYCVYFLCTELLRIHYLASNVIAWVAAVLFAFGVNKVFVFASKNWQWGTVWPELWKFVSARLLSGGLETLILFLFVELLRWNDGVVKVGASVLVVVLNYVISKAIIFKKD